MRSQGIKSLLTLAAGPRTIRIFERQPLLRPTREILTSLMAILQALNGNELGQRLTLDGQNLVLGRHPDCDIVLDSAAVSRQHARIVRDGADFFIEDLHSRNGTIVNGQAIQQRRLLTDGDRLKICELVFAFYHNEPSSVLRKSSGLETMGEVPVLLEDEPRATATIMGKVDVTVSRSGSLLAVNPEMKLRAMIEISHSLSKAVRLDDVLPKLLDSLLKIFPQADRAFVVLRNPTTGQLVPQAMRHRRPHQEEQIRISRSILDEAVKTKEAILSADAGSDTRFDTSQSIAELRIRSVMCAPLVDNEGNALGAFQIEAMDARHRFRDEDLQVLASIASQSAVAVDNAQMHERALKQNAVERDLELAHKVQRGLLPSAPPILKDYFFFDFYESANQVGGDYYDYVELPGSRLAVVLGDVSGKGVSAALVMAKLSGEVRYCLAAEPDPARAVCQINANFCRSGWDDRFVTFVLAVLDPKRHEVCIVNAGHMPPFLRSSAGLVEAIGEQESGIPLGVTSDYPYEQCTRSLAPGECVVAFTDGFSEAMNAKGELYGLTRLQTQVSTPGVAVTGLGRLILEDVKKFVGGHPQSDDMCLTCFGRSG